MPDAIVTRYQYKAPRRPRPWESAKMPYSHNNGWSKVLAGKVRSLGADPLETLIAYWGTHAAPRNAMSHKRLTCAVNPMRRAMHAKRSTAPPLMPSHRQQSHVLHSSKSMPLALGLLRMGTWTPYSGRPGMHARALTTGSRQVRIQSNNKAMAKRTRTMPTYGDLQNSLESVTVFEVFMNQFTT